MMNAVMDHHIVIAREMNVDQPSEATKQEEWLDDPWSGETRERDVLTKMVGGKKPEAPDARMQQTAIQQRMHWRRWTAETMGTSNIRFL